MQTAGPGPCGTVNFALITLRFAGLSPTPKGDPGVDALAERSFDLRFEDEIAKRLLGNDPNDLFGAQT